VNSSYYNVYQVLSYFHNILDNLKEYFSKYFLLRNTERNNLMNDIITISYCDLLKVDVYIYNPRRAEIKIHEED